MINKAAKFYFISNFLNPILIDRRVFVLEYSKDGQKTKHEHGKIKIIMQILHKN